MVFEKGTRFTFRDGNLTIGTGVITNILPKLTEAEKEYFKSSKKKKEKMEAPKAVEN